MPLEHRRSSFVAGHGAGPGDLADPRLLLGAVGVRAIGAAHEQLRAHPRSLQGRGEEQGY